METPPELAETDAHYLLSAIDAVAAQAGIGFVIADSGALEPHIVHLSAGAEKILGRSIAELGGATVSEIFAPRERERIREVLCGRVGDAGARFIRTAVLRQDGTSVPVQLGSTRIVSGARPIGVILLLDDRVRGGAQSSAQHSEQSCRLVVDHGPEGVVILKGGLVHFLCPRAAQLLGLESPEQATGRPIGELLDDVGAGELYDRRADMGPQGTPERSECRMVDRHGNARFVEIVSIPATYAGEPTVIGIVRDVTARKLLQERLTTSDRLAALGMLSAAIAHEINSPLTYVSLGLDQLRQALCQQGGWPESKTAEIVQRFEELQQWVSRAATIVRDLKTFSRIEALQLRAVSVTDALERAIRLSDNEVRQRCQLVRHYEDVPLVRADSARLEQVFVNVLLNAAQAIVGDAEENRVEVRVYQVDSHHVAVEVRDTGVGIPTEIQGRVFEPFFSTKPAGVGTGLGLAICRNLIEAQQGKISIESDGGKGTTVTIILAVASGAAQPEAGVKSMEHAEGRLRVLVIDDEPLIGRLIAQLLADEHEVRTVTSVHGALALLREGQSFDVALCDVMMPGGGGRAFYEALADIAPELRARLIFMTGGAYTDEQVGFLESVDNPRLTKPFDVNDLKLLIVERARCGMAR